MAKDWATTIRGLIANADDERLSDEARATYRAKAEELMITYRVDQEAKIAEGAGDVPILSDIVVSVAGQGGRLVGYYTDAWAAIARHCGVRYVMDWNAGYTAHVVGYAGDVQYADFLWTSTLLMFSTRINPRWDAALTMEENVYRLRAAGKRRKDVANAAGLDGDNPAHRSRVQRIYVAECKRRNETPLASGLGHQADVFQDAYAEEFVTTLRRRLREARDAADSVRGGLVLHGRADRVNEAFYGRYPHMRPQPMEDRPVAPSEPCPRCAANKSGHCRQHPAYTVTKADMRRWSARDNSAGRVAGRAAAEGVVISRGHTPAQRVSDATSTPGELEK